MKTFKVFFVATCICFIFGSEAFAHSMKSRHGRTSMTKERLTLTCGSKREEASTTPMAQMGAVAIRTHKSEEKAVTVFKNFSRHGRVAMTRASN